MGCRQIVEFFDDLDNTPLSESEVRVVRFSVDKTEYVMDLSEKNADAFYQALRPYLEVARIETSAGARTHVRKPRGKISKNVSRDIRSWAAENGIDVASRGKIPQKIWDAYSASQQSPASQKDSSNS